MLCVECKNTIGIGEGIQVCYRRRLAELFLDNFCSFKCLRKKYSIEKKGYELKETNTVSTESPLTLLDLANAREAISSVSSIERPYSMLKTLRKITNILKKYKVEIIENESMETN